MLFWVVPKEPVNILNVVSDLFYLYFCFFLFNSRRWKTGFDFEDMILLLNHEIIVLINSKLILLFMVVSNVY